MKCDFVKKNKNKNKKTIRKLSGVSGERLKVS